MQDNFCVMPFVHAFVTPNIISPCCAYSSDLRYNTKEQYWESEQLKAIQKNMLDNNRDPGCDICWKKEDRGYSSLRQHSNEIYKEHIESTTYFIDKLRETNNSKDNGRRLWKGLKH